MPRRQSIHSPPTLKKCKQSLKARELTNKELCSKFMYTINARNQLWLEECMTATSQSRVDDSIINFRLIIEQVCFGTFKLRLLSVFTDSAPVIKATPTPKIDNKIEDPDDKKGNNKKNNKRVINNSPSKAFKLA
jgi:hypothetical protein